MPDPVDEGVIKYRCHWTEGPPIEEHRIKDLGTWRDRLYTHGLIGVYPGGVGYGNISMRTGDREFLITGSGTGIFPQIDGRHYAFVWDYDLHQNSLSSTGPVKASSESLSHAAIYDKSPDTAAVFHVHHRGLWQKMLGVYPTTDPAVAYGTPEMAFEIQQLLMSNPELSERKVIIMGGHIEGLLIFGSSLDEAGRTALGLIA